MKNDYFEETISFDNLYKGLKTACKNVRWKNSVVGYEFNGLHNTLSLMNDLLNDSYKLQKYQEFIIHEPKERKIVATRIRDRQFQSSLCNSGLYDDVCEHFVRDNVACQKGRGTDDALNRLKIHMRRYYRKHGNEGWVLRCDIKSFFASIDHDVAKRCIDKYVSDVRARNEVHKIIDSFDSGIGLGSEVSQLIALCVLNDLDHFIKENLRIKHYIRYMDDFLLIHNDKDYIRRCRAEIELRLKGIGLILNRKTSIHPLKNGIKFLQWRFILTDSGKVIMLINHKKVTNEKRRIRKLLEKEFKGEIPKGTSFASMQSWLSNARRGNTYNVQQEMIRYYRERCKTYDRSISSEKIARNG